MSRPRGIMFSSISQTGKDKCCIDPCCYCCSVAKLQPTLCDPMDCCTRGFLSLTISLSLLKFMSIESLSLTISSSAAIFSFWLQSFPASRSFPGSQLFTSGSQSLGASALASVLPMNIQGWFPLGLTGLISLQSEGLSRIFSSTTIHKTETDS